MGWVLIWLPIAWIVAFGVLARFVRRVGLSPWWSWPVLWIAIEFIRSEWSPLRLDWFSATLDPLRFSWLVLGHSRLSEPLLAQSADLWGGYGLSLAPVLSNLFLADFLSNRRVPRLAAILTGALIAGEIVYGSWAFGRESTRPPIAVGVVQSERESLMVLQDLTDQLIADAAEIRIVVWPEESFSESLGDLTILQAFASQRNLILAVGVEHPVEGQPHENLAYLIAPNAEIGVYHKREAYRLSSGMSPDPKRRRFR